MGEKEKMKIICPNCLSPITLEERRMCKYCRAKKCIYCICACQENKDENKS